MNAMTQSLEADLPLYDETRPVLKWRPFRAWHHFRELLKDKERTEEVFKIFESMPWRGLRPAGENFLRSQRGQALRAREPFLPAILDDHAALRQTQPGSLAHAYCDFMEREGLTAQGLVDEFAKFAADKPKHRDQFEWYMNRMRDVHDLLHVLTGYSRDSLGEACVLAFTYSQQPSPAHLFIGYMAGLNIRKLAKSNAPVLTAIREGQRLGKACPRLCEQSITELLPLPLEEVRRRLNITPATNYQRCHQIWRGMGINPYDLLAARKSASQEPVPQAA